MLRLEHLLVDRERALEERPLKEQTPGEVAKQWIVIGLAVLCEPKVLILDESSAALDLGARVRLHEEIARLRDGGATILIVTHRIAGTARAGDRPGHLVHLHAHGVPQHLQMTGADERMAFAFGVRTDVARIGAYMLGGICVGLAAIWYTALTRRATRRRAAPTALALGGASLTGGRGGAIGSILGSLDMYLISSLLATFDFGLVSGYITQLCFGAILIASLLINILLTGPGPTAR
jgi:branched-subunit amino acid transport system permease